MAHLNRSEFIFALTSGAWLVGCKAMILPSSTVNNSMQRAASSLANEDRSEVQKDILRRIANLPDFADFWLKNIKDASIKAVLLSKISDPIFMAGVAYLRRADLQRLFIANIPDIAKRLMLELELENYIHETAMVMGHFIGVHNTLQKWGCRRDVCLAGLFHAIYGTEFYIEMALDSTKEDHRRRLALAIGTEAEKLTFLYGTHDEGKIFIKNDLAKLGDKVISNFRTGEESRITQDIFSDFADILVANGDEPLERALGDSRFMVQNSESLKKFGSFMPLALHLHEEAKVVLGIIQKVLSS